MPGDYRISVRGIMSDRFCQGFCGLSRRIEGDRTVLEGEPLGAPPVQDVLTMLDNLGLEVLAVEGAHGTREHTTLEA